MGPEDPPAGGRSTATNLTLTLDGGPEGAWSYSGPPPFPWPSEDEPWPTIETGEPVTVAPAFPMPGAPLPDSYPSRAEARTLARAIVEELGHDPDAFEWRDGPSSVARTVEAWWIIDGHTTPVKMELGFGPDGMLVFASGQLVAPDAGPVAERIGTAAAEDRLRAEIERMRAQPLGLGNTLVGGVVVAGDPDAPVVLADPDQPPLTGAPIDGGSGTTAPVPTVPPDMVGRIVDVESSWTTNHDDDGPRLLPSYTFIEATGMRYTVSALA